MSDSKLAHFFVRDTAYLIFTLPHRSRKRVFNIEASAGFANKVDTMSGMSCDLAQVQQYLKDSLSELCENSLQQTCMMSEMTLKLQTLLSQKSQGLLSELRLRFSDEAIYHWQREKPLKGGLVERLEILWQNHKREWSGGRFEIHLLGEPPLPRIEDSVRELLCEEAKATFYLQESETIEEKFANSLVSIFNAKKVWLPQEILIKNLVNDQEQLFLM